MDAATKATAVQGVFNMLNSQFATISVLTGLNVPALLDNTQATGGIVTPPIVGGAGGAGAGAGGGGSGAYIDNGGSGG